MKTLFILVVSKNIVDLDAAHDYALYILQRRFDYDQIINLREMLSVSSYGIHIEFIHYNGDISKIRGYKPNYYIDTGMNLELMDYFDSLKDCHHTWLMNLYTIIDMHLCEMAYKPADRKERIQQAMNKSIYRISNFLNSDKLPAFPTRVGYGMIDVNDVAQIKDVIFNNPATIVFWSDGTKTVVKCQEGENYDPEKGLAMAMAKKSYGNKYGYYNEFKHWLKKAK